MKHIKMINILIVDDHNLIRTGLSHILTAVDGFTVVGQAKNGEEAIQLTQKLEPDVILMDLKMPGIGGLEATKRLLLKHPSIKIITISSCDDPLFPNRLIRAGAKAYLTKDANPDEIIKAIKTVVRGEVYLSEIIAHKIACSSIQNTHDSESAIAQLSEREMQIAQMIVHGSKVSDIAKHLNISAKTVNTYRYRLFEKLNIESDVELVHFSIKHQAFDIDSLD